MRERAIAEVEGGGSRREAAEEVEVSPSTAIVWRGQAAVRKHLAVGEACRFLLGLIEHASAVRC
jgi:transposase-like protein